MSILFDLRYTCRRLLNKPGFSLFTTLIMACGLGLCIYMYSIINSLILKPLPFVDGERMVMITPSINGVRLGDSPISFMDYQNIKQNSQRLEQIGYFYADTVNINLDGRASRYVAIRAQSNLFSYTGIQPQLGRVFNEQDTGDGANPVVIISHELWHNYFSGRKDILSQSLLVNGIRTKIIGVMPKTFAFPLSNQIWLPSTLNSLHFTVENAPEVDVFAKIVSGYTLADVDVELKNIMSLQEQRFPDINGGRSAFAITFMDSFMGEESKPIFFVMLLAVGLVLLLACCNVGNLLLVRAGERSKEIAIRIALGARPLRIISQMMWESIILCSLGGFIGLLFAGWGISLTRHLLPSLVPDQPPFWWKLNIDANVIMKTVSLVVIASLITGALPAWRIIKANINSVLRDGTRGAQSRSSRRMSKILVIFEITLSCSVVCVGILLSLIVSQTSKIDYGIQSQNIWTAKINLPEKTYHDEMSKINFISSLANALASRNTVKETGLMNYLPGQMTPSTSIEIEGNHYLLSNRNQSPKVNDVVVYPGTLELLGIVPKEGRLLLSSDDLHSQKAVLITESFVKRYLSHEKQVIGKRIRLNEGNDQSWYTIMGIIPHIIQGRPFGPVQHRPSIYRSMLQVPQKQLSVLVTATRAEDLSNEIQHVVDSIDHQLPIYQEKTLQKVIDRNTAGLKYIAMLFNLFGMIAIVLAGSGIYAVMAVTINQRYSEFGTRRALGATAGNIIALIMKLGVWQVGIGLIISMPIIAAIYPIIRTIFDYQGISIILLFSITALMITLVVILATLLPARRAIMISPMEALRYQ